MNLVDYTGNVNQHEEYLELLKILEEKCQMIEYTIINDEDLELIERFKEEILSVNSKRKWWGTKSSKERQVYKIKSSSEVFRYLRQFETFCKFDISQEGDIIQETDFGINDIAFFGNQELPLLFTTTHEGYITVREDVMRKIKDAKKRMV